MPICENCKTEYVSAKHSKVLGKTLCVTCTLDGLSKLRPYALSGQKFGKRPLVVSKKYHKRGTPGRPKKKAKK